MCIYKENGVEVYSSGNIAAPMYVVYKDGAEVGYTADKDSALAAAATLAGK